MSTQSHASSTRADEIADGIFRISTPVPASVVPGGFTFNQYLIRDAESLLFHTGPRRLFGAVLEAIERVIPVATLRYISFSHVEADECGSLNQFLAAAPQAVPLCGQIAAMVSIGDLADRPPRALADQERLDARAAYSAVDRRAASAARMGVRIPRRDHDAHAVLWRPVHAVRGGSTRPSPRTTFSSQAKRHESAWTTTRTRLTPAACSSASRIPRPPRWRACTARPGAATARRLLRSLASRLASAPNPH